MRSFLLSEFPNGKPPRQALALMPISNVLCITTSQLPKPPLPRTWNAPAALALPDFLDGFPWSTVGTALDFRLRFYLGGSFASARVAAAGARLLAEHWRLTTDFPRAFEELAVRFEELTQRDTNWSHTPTAETRSLLAQYSFVLALYEQCFRALFTDDWPIVSLGANATLDNLIGTVHESAIRDISSMAELFVTTQQEMLAATSVVLNPAFGAASAQLGGADADLIVDGRLIDVKTKRNATVDLVDLWQILGYAFSDYNDEYQIREVGFYFSRHGLQVAWSLDALMELMAGAPKNLANVRMQFRDVLDGIMSIPRVLSNPVRTGAGLTVREKRIAEELAWDEEKDRRREAKKTALVAHPLVFRPSISGTGKWHVAYSENKYVYPPSDGLNVEVRPSCGARRVQLDRVATPLKLVVDSSRNEYAAQCCSRCLEYSDQTYSSVHQYPIPKIGPKERWRFSEPKNARQKWHVRRSDFYVNEKFVSSVCSSVGEFKSGGSTIPVAEADALDLRFCSYCLQIVSDGGPKWVLNLAPR